jgi:hypothetical protein
VNLPTKLFFGIGGPIFLAALIVTLVRKAGAKVPEKRNPLTGNEKEEPAYVAVTR